MTDLRAVTTAGTGTVLNESKGLSLVVELDPLDAGLSPGRAGRGIDTDALHGREVDDEASVANRVAWEAVASPAHGRLQSIIPGEFYCANNVRSPGTAGNQRWPSVKHPVPHLAGVIVALVAWADESATLVTAFMELEVAIRACGELT
jgi:hypothetical protein